jgi:hypothetical protein
MIDVGIWMTTSITDGSIPDQWNFHIPLEESSIFYNEVCDIYTWGFQSYYFNETDYVAPANP